VPVINNLKLGYSNLKIRKMRIFLISRIFSKSYSSNNVTVLYPICKKLLKRVYKKSTHGPTLSQWSKMTFYQNVGVVELQAQRERKPLCQEN
jgi:hypothetical protein